MMSSIANEPSPADRDICKYLKDTKVRIVGEEALAVRGENSRLSRLKLSNGDSLVAKRRPQSDAARRVAAIQCWYEREVYWYTHLSKHTPEVRCPKCALARYDWLTGAFVLVLEDLSDWKPLGQDLESLCSAVRLMGKLHKRWLGIPLPKLPKTPIHLELAQLIEAYFVDAWSRVKLAPHFDFAPHVLELLDALAVKGLYVTLARYLASSPNATLLHGDFRPANIVHQDSSTLCVYDWQFVSTGAGAYDFAYFVALAVPIEQRRQIEGQLKDIYLLELGQSNLLTRDLQAAVLLALASFVMGALTATDVHTHQVGIDRLAAAAIDWGFADPSCANPVSPFASDQPVVASS